MTEPLPDLESLDFIYCGQRLVAGNKMGVKFTLLREGRPAGTFVTQKAGRGTKVVGGVYTGARFSKETAVGTGEARFVRMWEDSAEVMTWEALDGAAIAEARSRKLAADASRVSEIERLLIPLRKLHQTSRARNDHAGLEALEAAVLRALRTPIRAADRIAEDRT